MEEWKEYLLEDVGTITTGKTPKTAVKEYFGGTIPFVTPADINTPYKYIAQTDRYLTEEGLNSIINNSIEKGSICVSCIGNIGYTGIVQNKCASNQQINSIIVNKQYDRDFVYYAIKNLWPYFKSYEGQSTTVSILNKGQFSKIPIKCPSLSTQRKIASILSSLDDKIEVNRKINENLEQQAQALFKSWFVDFEPFKNGEFIESELGMIPKGWRVAKFGDFIKVSTEKAPVDSFPEYSVTNNGIIPRDKKFNKKLSMSSSKNKVLRKDNLVFGMSREILNWGVMEDEVGGVSSAYNVYILNKEIISPTYLKLYMKARISDFNSLIGTAAREGQSLDKGQLIQMQIYIPSESTLRGFFNVYYPLTDKIQAVEDESRRLAELRDTLLPKLMSGELKVNEIEI